MRYMARRMKKHIMYWKTAQTSTILLIVFLTMYTFVLFFKLIITLQFGELVIYLTPSFALAMLLLMTFKLEKLSGVLFVCASFVFLFIYRVHISLAVSALLLFIGILLIKDSNLMHLKQKRKGKAVV